MTEIERRKVVVSMPVKGFAFSMEKVNDAVFAQEMIGPGFAAMPSEGVLYAPVDGKIGMLANTLRICFIFPCLGRRRKVRIVQVLE